MQNENYTNARTLATVEHCGETFRIVRRRINGKPWRLYLALVHGATYVANLDPATTAEQGLLVARERLAKCFATREALLASLEPILTRYNPATEN